MPSDLRLIFAWGLKQGLRSCNKGVYVFHVEASWGGSQMRTGILGAIRIQFNFVWGLKQGLRSYSEEYIF